MAGFTDPYVMKKIWNSAKEMADNTPSHRNRFIDAIRAMAILVVVFGHWLVAVVVVGEKGTTAVNLLDAEPWTQWLTWGFQVMPLFFIVGGYASAASWLAAERSGTQYRTWLGQRLRRLLTPVVPLLVFWVVFANLALLVGIDSKLVSLSTMGALVPVWFLAVYILLTMAAPFAYRAWRSFGYQTLGVTITAAALTDLVMRTVGSVSLGNLEIDLVATVGWGNFVWVWGSMLLMGFAWHDRKLPHFAIPGLTGAVLLIGLTEGAGYVRSMVGVAGEGLNNNSPPSLALVALGLVQLAMALAAEDRANRFLQNQRPWAATIVMNAMIMTTYLWHLTVMVLVAGLGVYLGGVGYTFEPATIGFWATRPVMLAVYALASMPVILIMSKYERPRATGGHPQTRQQLVGAACVFFGLAVMAKNGLVGDAGFNWMAALLPLVGAGVIGLFQSTADQSTVDRDRVPA